MKVKLFITEQGIPWVCTDLPEVSEARLEHLEKGLPRVGSTLKKRDILIGIARSTRPLSSGEIEIADLGLWHAGFEDLWINDSYYVTEETCGVVRSVSRRFLKNITDNHELHPLRYLQFCSQFPVGTPLIEIEIIIERNGYVK